MKKRTLKQIGYYITGESLLNLWGGGRGSIEMKPYKIKKATKETILACVNDNGFGVESIESASIDIYDLYENNYKEFNRTIEADKNYSDYFLNWNMLQEKNILINFNNLYRCNYENY